MEFENFLTGVYYTAVASVVAVAMAPLLTLGPIDVARTGYNVVIGDAQHTMKRSLVGYVREGIRQKTPELARDGKDLDEAVANAVGVTYRGTPVVAEDISTIRLWDASEEHAHSGFDRWFWPSLDQ